MQFANNKRELHTPADMVNLKMRTYGDLQMSLMRSLGADPTQLSWSELYSALQTGAVDGNMNGYQTLYSGSPARGAAVYHRSECNAFAL